MNCQSTVQIGTESVLYGSKEISFFFRREERKSMRITVTPELSVFVAAPIGAKMDFVQEKIVKRGAWILKQLEYFSTFHPRKTVRHFQSWETHLYLGREYLLDVVISNQKESVKIKGKHIQVVCKEPSRAEGLMNAWYSKNAKEKIDRLFWPLVEKFKKHWVSPSELILRKMSRRWGSCSKNGKITLNSMLIQAPKGCIEYVMVHELCHLIHFGHTKKFYELQAKTLPSWEKWKERLEKIMAQSN